MKVARRGFVNRSLPTYETVDHRARTRDHRTRMRWMWPEVAANLGFVWESDLKWPQMQQIIPVASAKFNFMGPKVP